MKLFKRVLIANRGEIAVRIIRACHELGIETVAVYSKVDIDSLHVGLATTSICVGGNRASESYLNMPNIIMAALETGCEAIHPGFGFLSENDKFAGLCEEAGLKFIGPKKEIIASMGNKSAARTMMQNIGVPVIPGSDGKLTTYEQAKELANQIGYPVFIKASSGGGGKGMRLVHEQGKLKKSMEEAMFEAKNAFSDESIYMEKFVENPKHIEVQILADEFGNVIHLGERDCSVQRNNQKLIEEAPSIYLDDVTRQKMLSESIKAAESIGYQNAGTIEFLVDKDLNYYFIEMNTRIQVEHPITEMITGIDIVKQQIIIASGNELEIKQEDINVKGHSIECRVNMEDPDNNFSPTPGTIEMFNFPGGNGVRIDTGVYQGYKVSPFYDSMVAKIIVHGHNRHEAIEKMKQALMEFVVGGNFKNNIEFQYKLITHPTFINGNYNTGFIQNEILIKE